ncbi:MAG: hypothetical protein JRI68_16425 [Deltaproteobacteria bacterium]|nr:hypothetical protein [Deltaproteobacteria bacterium]
MAKQSPVEVTVAQVEEVLSNSPAFAKIETHFYVVRQGSAYVYVHVLPWGDDRAIVRLVAQLARGVEMTPDLALRLLRINARMRFGAFGYVERGACVVLSHTLLGGPTLDRADLLSALRSLAVTADEYDDHIVDEAGGKRLQDLLDDHASATLLNDLTVKDGWDA